MKHKHLVTSTNDQKNPRFHWPLKKVNKVWTQALLLCLWVFAIWILGLWCWNITWTWCRNSLGCGGGRPAYRLPWNNVIPRANSLWEERVLHLKWDPRQARVRNPLLSTILTVPTAQLGVTQPGLNPCFIPKACSPFLLVGPQYPCCEEAQAARWRRTKPLAQWPQLTSPLSASTNLPARWPSHEEHGQMSPLSPVSIVKMWTNLWLLF